MPPRCGLGLFEVACSINLSRRWRWGELRSAAKRNKFRAPKIFAKMKNLPYLYAACFTGPSLDRGETGRLGLKRHELRPPTIAAIHDQAASNSPVALFDSPSDSDSFRLLDAPFWMA